MTTLPLGTHADEGTNQAAANSILPHAVVRSSRAIPILFCFCIAIFPSLARAAVSRVLTAPFDVAKIRQVRDIVRRVVVLFYGRGVCPLAERWTGMEYGALAHF